VAESSTQAGEWVSVHAYYHADLDGMLLATVAPLVTALRSDELVDDWFFLRYWEGGNHLRLRMRPRHGARAEVRHRTAAVLHSYLSAHPSPDLVDEVDYRALARLFTAGEQRIDVPAKLAPNNTFAFVPYVPEHQRYGDGRSLAAVERHFGESSRLALDVLRAVPDPRRRISTCFPLVVLAWLTAQPEPTALARWTTGLYEAWAGRFGDIASSVDTPPDLDERYHARQAPLLRVLADAQQRAAAPVLADDGRLTARWLVSVRGLRDELMQPLASGRFHPAARPGWEGLADSHEPADSVLEVLDICAHLLCNRLGLTSAQECHVRFLAARALVDRAGIAS